MKAALLNPNGFHFEDIAIPTAGPGEVLVKTRACGICEGDVFQYRTRTDKAIAGELIGHEGSGVIAGMGEGVIGFEIGDVVTATAGTYSEYFVAPAAQLVKLTKTLSPERALGEPVACFVHAARRFGIQPGDRVVLIGCGYMGMGCLQMALIQGAIEVVVVEPISWRREAASAHGAHLTYDPTGKSPEQVLEDLGEFDCVIEATGAAGVIDTCTDLVKQHGRIVLVGYHQSEDGRRNVDMKTWNFKAIDIMNGHVRREVEKVDAMREGMELVDAGKLDFGTLVQEYDFSKIEEAFADLTSRKEGLFKAVLTFSN